jgi:hypothetical protein
MTTVVQHDERAAQREARSRSLGATALMTAPGLAFAAFAVDLLRPLRRV